MVPWRNSRKPRQRSALAPAAFIDPCLPTRAEKVPSADGWIHEIKHDGFRLQIHVRGKRVRLYTMTGMDWTKRYPWIVEDVSRLKIAHAILDAECCCDGDNGVTDFDRLMARGHDASAYAYAFDLLAIDDRDVRREPLEQRKAALAKLLRKAKPGIRLSEHLTGPGHTIYVGHNPTALALPERIKSRAKPFTRKVREMADSIAMRAEPDQIEQDIIRVLELVHAEKWKGKSWTRNLLFPLSQLGERLGYYPCATGCLNSVESTQGEWLWDLVWLNYSKNHDRLISLPLVLESEWVAGISRDNYLDDDFQKLLTARAEHRVMICGGSSLKLYV